MNPFDKKKPKKKGVFETDCIFKECIINNHNHMYNIARHDVPYYYFEEEVIPKKKVEKPKPKPKPKPPPPEKEKVKAVKEKPKPEPVA